MSISGRRSVLMFSELTLNRPWSSPAGGARDVLACDFVCLRMGVGEGPPYGCVVDVYHEATEGKADLSFPGERAVHDRVAGERLGLTRPAVSVVWKRGLSILLVLGLGSPLSFECIPITNTCLIRSSTPCQQKYFCAVLNVRISLGAGAVGRADRQSRRGRFRRRKRQYRTWSTVLGEAQLERYSHPQLGAGHAANIMRLAPALSFVDGFTQADVASHVSAGQQSHNSLKTHSYHAGSYLKKMLCSNTNLY